MEIEEFLKLVKPALNPKLKWVAMDSNGRWRFYLKKPKICTRRLLDFWEGYYCGLGDVFKIDPVPDWKKSLIKISDVA